MGNNTEYERAFPNLNPAKVSTRQNDRPISRSSNLFKKNNQSESDLLEAKKFKKTENDLVKQDSANIAETEP